MTNNITPKLNKKTGRLESNKGESLRSILSSLMCIACGILLCELILIILAAFSPDIPFSDAMTGFAIILGGPFARGSASNILFNFGDMLLESTPILLTGLSVAVAQKTGLFNIGAPGQYLMEVKIGASMPMWLSEQLAELGIYKTSFSKYGRAFRSFVTQTH